MHDLSWELTVILITVRCLQKLGKDWQYVKKQYRKLNELEVRKQYQTHFQTGL